MIQLRSPDHLLLVGILAPVILSVRVGSKEILMAGEIGVLIVELVFWAVCVAYLWHRRCRRWPHPSLSPLPCSGCASRPMLHCGSGWWSTSLTKLIPVLHLGARAQDADQPVAHDLQQGIVKLSAARDEDH